MRPSSPSEKVVVSMNTTPTEAPAPVSMTSPWKMGEPEVSVTSVPSARVAVAVPSMVWTWPMGGAASDSPACADCAGAAGPAKASARSGGTRAPPSVISTGGASLEKKSRTTTVSPSGPSSTRSAPSRM